MSLRFLFTLASCLCAASLAFGASQPQPPPPPSCATGAVFTPFSLVPPTSPIAGVAPISGRIVRLDFCSDETQGTLAFQRLVLREMKVQDGEEVASYTVLTPASGDTVQGLSEAAFSDTSKLVLVLPGLSLRGTPDGQSVRIAFGTEAPQAAVLEQEDRIAIAQGACGTEGQLERSVFQIDAFRLQSEVCRVTHQFGSRYTFRTLTVQDPPQRERTLKTADELEALDYRYTHHNANDGWTLKLGSLAYDFTITDDLALFDGKPSEVKVFRVTQGTQVLREVRIADPSCTPLSCKGSASTQPAPPVPVLPPPNSPHCDRPFLFFDLGLNTLVDTSQEDPQTHEMIDVHYVPGAREYLAKLHELGYPLGLLVDVPEGWGQDDATALASTQKYLTDAWTKAPGAPVMDWTVFDPKALFFPPKTEYRKASGSLYLFQKGLTLALSHGCPAIHQATRPKEIALAKLAGMRAYQVGVPGQDYFLPIDKIQELVK